jgi:hypothetical protein
MRSGGIQGQHATEGCGFGIRGVRRKITSVRSQGSIQATVNDSGLNPNGLGSDFFDCMHVTREIDHKSRTECLATDTGSCTASDNRDLVFARVSNQSLEIFTITGAGDAEWRDLMQAAIGGIQGTRNRIAQNFSTENSGKVFDQSGLSSIHRMRGLLITETEQPHTNQAKQRAHWPRTL